jgi:hypothetical protein
MSESLVELVCPRDGHQWYEDLQHLEKLGLVIYKDGEQARRVERYRARCPKDGTYLIIDVAIKAEAGSG